MFFFEQLLTYQQASVSHAGYLTSCRLEFLQVKQGGSLQCAGVVELVDTPDLGSGGESRGGSSPFTRTKICQLVLLRVNFEATHGILIDCIGMIAFSIEVSVNKIGIRK